MQKNDKYINLIFKQLTNEADENDILQLNEWLDNKDNKAIFEDYKKTWNIANKLNEPDILNIEIEDEWAKIQSKIGFSKTVQFPEKKKTSNFLKFAVSIAAVLILVFGLIFILKPKQKTIFAEAQIVETELIDGTNIILNKGSEISYAVNFNKKNRNIKLTGEAYFNVEHNPEKPFIIETENFYVEVLGTKFYVNSTSNQVIVNEGIVIVYSEKSKSDSVILNANKKLILEQNKFLKSENQNQNFLSWKTKKIIFNNHKFSEIATILEKVYNIEIKILNPKINDLQLTVSFDSQDIESVITVLEATLNVTITKKGNTFEIDFK